MPFAESKRAKNKRYYFDHHHCGRPACTVQRSIIDLSGICSLYRLKAAPQIHNLFHQKLQLPDTKCNVVGMAEQICKKKSTDTR